ncbi:MAG: hypothetical protein C4519_02120 [Desulfobacteraceae bacterium]|nr:MAG: hypothetical protein C4519_02120 [Desulfobacteraceae bacterium]
MRRIASLAGQLSLAALLIPAISVRPAAPVYAELYKYQKDGVWYFTDTPPEDMPADGKVIEESGRPAPAPPPEGTPLLAGYPARNPIEQASAATVAVKSALGFGSGFFISRQGHILTNKHVVRSTEKQSQETEAHFKEAEGRIGEFDQRFAGEEERLQVFRKRLNQMKAAADAEPHAERRKILLEDYQVRHREYEERRADFEKRYHSYKMEKKAFIESRGDYNYSKSIADLARSFTIVLADKTELYARLIQVSVEHDLALLKLDGYQTPALSSGQTRLLAQSDPVYAIGSPARLQNSVTSGVFSGFQQGFLQTNAQIYPGNSGGPLVSAEGHVLGINTFKTLTRKFEGLGFAIPIEIALREFNPYLP